MIIPFDSLVYGSNNHMWPAGAEVHLDDDHRIVLELSACPADFLGAHIINTARQLAAQIGTELEVGHAAVKVANALDDTSSSKCVQFEPTPSEARALAAALVHYAEEAERR